MRSENVVNNPTAPCKKETETLRTVAWLLETSGLSGLVVALLAFWTERRFTKQIKRIASSEKEAAEMLERFRGFDCEQQEAAMRYLDALIARMERADA